MKTMKLLAISMTVVGAAPLWAQAAAPAATPGAGAAAAAPVSVAAGATVYDTQGGEVGSVDSVTGGVAVISTGTNKVGLPLTSFAMGEKGPIIAMTKTEVDAAANKAAADAAAALKAQLTPGASVYGSGGTKIGTVKEADDQFVTITMPKGPVKLPIATFSKGASGAMIGMTADDLNKAVAAASAK
ncbi:MAG: hypothetical protein JWM38_438 [Sphingomonas bacterium]|nr:hypothetical protein [Sphingomonas bacterium]